MHSAVILKAAATLKPFPIRRGAAASLPRGLFRSQVYLSPHASLPSGLCRYTRGTSAAMLAARAFILDPPAVEPGERGGTYAVDYYGGGYE